VERAGVPSGTHLLYVPASIGAHLSSRQDRGYLPGELYMAARTHPIRRARRRVLTAVDAASGTVRWRYRSAKPMVGASRRPPGAGFHRELTGDFLALDAETGRELYRFYTGSGSWAGS